MRKFWVLFTALLTALTVVGPVTGAAGQEGADRAIRLRAATFRPAAGEAPALPPGLTIAGYAQGQRGYYLVQFDGPVQDGWKAAVAAAGADLLDYVPDFAFKVRMTPAQARAVEAIDGVAWVGLFQPGYKLSPDLRTDGVDLFRVRLERGAARGAATAAVRAAGATLVGQDGDILLVATDASQIEAVARVLDVAWVENFAFHQKHNEYGAGVILGADTANAAGYDGSTQIAAVADTGLGGGTAATAHPDIPAGRITSIFNWSTGNSPFCYNVFPDGAQDVDSGHGTHTAASVLSDGGAGGAGKGTAPAASLVFQAVEEYIDTFAFCAGSPDGYYLVGIPSDLRDLYSQAYNAGARIHSNSWGSSVAGDYTLDSANTDDFVWDNPDLTITFSAGNAGVDNNSDGVIDNDSIGSPGTAKNVITVGASENDRQGDYQCDTGLGYQSHDAYQAGETCSSMGGQNLLGTWGSRYGYVGPMANDLTAGNAEQMAGWSSRGPTDDGRIKPDVVAPGTWVLSGYSNRYQEGYGTTVNPQNGVFQWDGWGMPASTDYKYMGGTSMSNPLVAGAATVVRDFYQKDHGHGASAALVKASLINSARDLLDENNDGADDNDYPIPNVHEGWGRVDLANAVDGSHQWVDEASGLGTGGSAAYQYTVAAGSAFKASLVWSDFPSTETANVNLVNDLDLVVTAPDGTQYLGNEFAGGWSQAGGGADRVNNVENVYVQSAAAGTWTVEISGFNVPQGPQPYALVVDAAASSDVPPAVDIVAPANGSTVAGTVTVQIDATDAEDAAGSLTVEWNVDGGTWQTAAYNAGSGYYEADWDTTAETDGSHTVNARATDSAANTATDANTVTVDNSVPPTLEMHVGDLDGSSVLNRRRWDATVTVTVHDASDNPLAGATVSGTWSNGTRGSGSCVTDGSGQCSITRTRISTRAASATFTVTDVSLSGWSYVAGDNHDPDGDSSGTAITISRP